MGNLWLYGGSTLASFLIVFFKVMQHKNVTEGHYYLAFINSYIMAAGEVLVISLIIKGGWATAITSGIGGSFGVVLSMWLHSKLFKRKP